ncbi:MAG: 3-deoxy-manno-octulosonate cytidylyltransferase [Bacteroidales bacterium]|nr:3-deoxy-manno-octulosonate cytidylyltransferase [Bacteroidales bacterium]
MKALAIIPARYGSTRFEGKPLSMLQGKEMILWVCEAVNKSNLFSETIVATDDLRIYDVVEKHGFKAMMTSSSHSNGTQRCEQVLTEEERKGKQYDVVVNVQGDEPMIRKEQLELVLNSFKQDNSTQIATLRKQIEDKDTLLSPNVVKVVASDTTALYFSRSVVPFMRGKTLEEGIQRKLYFKHIGLYAYRSDVLHRLVGLSPTPLEEAESLEQLRWLENGYSICVMTTTHDSFGIDTAEDLLALNQKLDSQT